jgi:3-deoxy-7-phosphoheptulonate synthase
MSFNKLRQLQSPESLIAEMPLPENLVSLKNERDRELGLIFSGADQRFIVIVGPCSAHNEDAVTDYCCRLAALQEKTVSRLFLIPRIYTNKPRTMGTGYKGMAHQPDPTGKPDIVEGIKSIRKMHLRIIAESGLTGADEMLYPENYTYLGDLLNYVAIGARSSENQLHRLTASGIGLPAGFKNPISGDIQVMLNSIHAAQQPHVFAYNGWEVETEGNPFAHAILRGAVDKLGNTIPNYHYEDLTDIITKYNRMELQNQAIIIDTNHSNSGRAFSEQPRIAREIVHSRSQSEAIKRVVKGLMIESFIVEGSQKVAGNVYGQSITDPCLGWDATARLLLGLADMV